MVSPVGVAPLPAVCRLGVSMIAVGLILDLVDFVTGNGWAWLWGGEHGPHLIVLIGMIFTLVGVIAYGALGARGEDRPVRFTVWSSILAAGLSLEAGVIHLAVVDEHFAEYPPFGWLFAFLALFQAMWSFAYLARPLARLATVAIAVNAGAVVIWATSRSVGLPIGPEPWTPEGIGPLDVLATGIELALIGVLAIGLLPLGRQLRREVTRPSAAALVGSVLLIVVTLTLTAFQSGGGHGDHSEATAPADAGRMAPPDSESATTGGHEH